MDRSSHYSQCNAQNDGWLQRRRWIENSKECDYSIDLHNDVLGIDKFLPNNLDINIRLHRAPDSLALMADVRKDQAATFMGVTRNDDPEASYNFGLPLTPSGSKRKAAGDDPEAAKKRQKRNVVANDPSATTNAAKITTLMRLSTILLQS